MILEPQGQKKHFSLRKSSVFFALEAEQLIFAETKNCFSVPGASKTFVFLYENVFFCLPRLAFVDSLGSF